MDKISDLTTADLERIHWWHTRKKQLYQKFLADSAALGTEKSLAAELHVPVSLVSQVLKSLSLRPGKIARNLRRHPAQLVRMSAAK